MKEDVKITYRGWPGHFICADACRFRLNTLLEYRNIKIVVSTVGRLVMPTTKKYEELGHERYFETMAFHAQDNGYWDADVTKEIEFASRWSWPDINQELEANAGHIAVVEEIKERILQGEFA